MNSYSTNFGQTMALIKKTDSEGQWVFYLPPIDEDTEGTLVTGITDTEYSFLCDILESDT